MRLLHFGLVAALGACGSGAREAEPMPASATVYCAGSDGEPHPCPREGEEGSGQEGTLRESRAAYRVEGAVVSDLVTGLTWQRGASEQPLTAGAATAYCAALELDGQRGFRLPSRLELVSLVDYGRHTPAIDVRAFPDTPSELFWTATPVAGTDRSWGVFFKTGLTSHLGAPSGRARCVR